MLEKQTVNTGVRLTEAQAAKLDLLAANLQISRNRVFGVLLDSAEVQTVPSVSVKLGKKTSRATERADRIV
jgi:hypothetical protein